MTRRDKWKKRPAVLRYMAFKDECRLNKVNLPFSGSSVIFTLEMPKSWKKSKKLLMNGKPHQQTPDLDNLLKSLMDAVYGQDCTVYDVRITKLWGISGSISILS